MKERQIILNNEYLKIELESGILIGTFKSESVDIDIAHTITNFRLEIQSGRNYPIISNIKAIKNISKEARDFMASEEGCEGVIAAALLIDSSIGQIIGNFFIKINKPLRPTKIFTDESSAQKWLAKFL
ncbi:MAG: hypothetical protein V4608_02770 [Bacteroidota bacterium]